MAKVREIRRRIRSVDSTKQITKAMEMVATSKIKKAQARIEGLRPYSNSVKDILISILSGGNGSSDPLFEQRDINTSAIVAVTADRGLCGAFNSGIIRMTEKLIEEKESKGGKVSLITVGKKALGYFRYMNREIVKSYTGISDSPTIQAAKELADFVADLFKSKEVDEVIVIYNQFCSAVEQKPTTENILPVQAEAKADDEADKNIDYIVEPSPEHIVGTISQAYLETTVFRVLADSAASEQAARRKAMKAATDNAEEMIENLTRTYNRARQALITQEIAEIVSGANALAHSK